MKAAVWFLWRSSPPPLPSPPLCLSHTHSPRLRLSPPPSTHTHPLQQWTEPPADSHGVTLFKSTQPSLPASSAGRPRSSRVLHFGYTLLLLFYTQTDTHTRTDAQADIFCLIMTAEMRRSSSTIAVSVKWRIPDGAASRRVIVRACSASAPGLCSKTKSWIRVAGAVWVHSDMFSFFLVTKHFRFEQLSVKLPLSLCWGGGCVVSTRVDAFVCF